MEFPSEIVLNEYPEEIGDLEALEANDEESSDMDEAGTFPDMEEEMEDLGEPQHRRRCFGCRYVGENKGPAMQHERIKEVFDLIRDGMGKTDPMALALEVHVLYTEIATKVNASRNRGVDPLPPWEPATILAHFRHHNTDPQMQLWLRIDRLQKLMKLMEEESLIKINRKTGKRTIDKDQAQIYDRTIQRWERLMGKDPSKMMYYDEDSHMKDPRGILDIGGKRVYQFFKKRKINE